MMDLLNLGTGLAMVGAGALTLAALALRSARLRRAALRQQLQGFDLPLPSPAAQFLPRPRAERASARVANRRLRELKVGPRALVA